MPSEMSASLRAPSGVEEDEGRLALRQHALDDVAARSRELFFVLLDQLEPRLPELKGNFSPRRLAQWSPVFTAAPGDGIELSADENGPLGLRDAAHPRLLEDVAHPVPRLCRVAVLGEVKEQGERVRLATAELSREVVDGGRLDLHAREAPDDLRRQLARGSS